MICDSYQNISIFLASEIHFETIASGNGTVSGSVIASECRRTGNILMIIGGYNEAYHFTGQPNLSLLYWSLDKSQHLETRMARVTHKKP